VLRYLRSTPAVYYCHESNRLLYEAMPARPQDDEAMGRRRLLNKLDPLPSLYRRHLRRVDQRNLRCAHRVLVNSRFTAGEVARIYQVAAEVSYHGVDTERFHPQGATRRPVVLSVGSLTRLKGFDFLIEAMARYPSGNRPALLITSNFEAPMERSYLEQLARERQVSVSFAGSVSDDDLVRLYNEATVVAYAPVREPFGLVPLEAMACATPVVAVAEGGIPESVVDGETGLLSDRVPERFAAALARLIEDPSLARRYGDRGREIATTLWTWEQAVTRLEGHLAGAAGEMHRASLGARPIGDRAKPVPNHGRQ
jgi:glycosyltransferase involved in cell wall biosynthesis